MERSINVSASPVALISIAELTGRTRSTSIIMTDEAPITQAATKTTTMINAHVLVN